jgi:hypothetical protein
MLGPLKSQGVRELDDSAMIMRVKFKTIPGEQFVIRREVFRMIQESFREYGIEFAHRNVTVFTCRRVKKPMNMIRKLSKPVLPRLPQPHRRMQMQNPHKNSRMMRD